MKKINLFTVVLMLVFSFVLTGSRLVIAGSISGNVTEYGTTTPIHNIEVRLFRSEDLNWAGEHAWIWVGNVFTEENGNYQFTNLEARQYHINIYDGASDSSDRHYVGTDLYHVQVFESAETPNMNFALRQAGLIWGYVRTDEVTPTPIPYAEVVVNIGWTKDGRDWHWFSTDENGMYRLWVLPSPGEFYPVHVYKASLNGTVYETKVAPGFYQATLAGVRGPDFYLSEGGKIQGRIVNEQGAGIPGVEIDPQIGRLDDPDVWTDADGYYTLTSLPATDKAFAFIDQYKPAVLNGVKYGSGERFVGPFTITPGAIVHAPDMTMMVAGTLEGVVTDENGIPIAGAEIEVQGYDINGYEAGSDEIYTDPLGQYTIDYLAPGTYTVRAHKDNWMMGKRDDIVITSGSLVDCDLVMKSAVVAASVSGKITNYAEIAPRDSKGNFIPNYCREDEYGIHNVELIAISGDVNYTDQDYIEIEKYLVGFIEDVDDGYDDYFVASSTEIPGEYSCVLPAGDIDLMMFTYNATENGDYVILHDYKRLNLIEGSTFPGQDFVGKTVFGTLKGNISVPAGSAFNPQRCIIIAINESNPSNSPMGDAIAFPGLDASYNFGNMPVGTYTLRAIADGFVTQTYEGIVVIEGESAIQDIAFVSGGVLSGVVTDGTVTIEGAMVKIVETGKTAITNADGTYTISGLAAGTYTVLVTKPGYVDYSCSVDVTDGAVTIKDIVLNPTVGSIKGKVQLSDGTPVNGARVVAYNVTEDSYKEDTTVGGIFTIMDLVAGDYILAVAVDGYEVTVFPPSGYLTLAEYEAKDITSTPIIISPIPPEFTCHSSVSADTLSIIIRSDVNLLSNPQITITQGAGTLAISAVDYTENPREFRVAYTVDPSDTVVIIDVAEGSTPVIPGNPGGTSFSFEVSADLVQTASTNVTNATGGEVTMMGTQDNTEVYVPPFALVGTDTDSTAVALTIKRYGDPGEPVEGTTDQSVSAVYDFEFEDEGVEIDVNHTVTVTMSFEKPEGMSQAEFEADLKIGFFKVQEQRWVYHTDPDSGISNIRINWNNSTIMFEVSHFTRFAIFVPGETAIPGDLDGDGDVDRNDLNIILSARNTPADGPDDPRDLDGDGMITALDARKLVLLCTRPRCACEEPLG